MKKLILITIFLTNLLSADLCWKSVKIYNKADASLWLAIKNNDKAMAKKSLDFMQEKYEKIKIDCKNTKWPKLADDLYKENLDSYIEKFGK